MMIKRLVIRDCIGIEELTLSPKKVNIISGGNERGKTSILETIEKGLFNVKRRAKFVRMNADKAYIEIETDDGVSIVRNVKEDDAGLDSGSVKVTKDGVPVRSPETFLKQLFGVTMKGGDSVFNFSPVDFMLKKDTEQTDILLRLLPITVTAKEALAWFGEAPRVNYEKHGLQVLKDLEQWFYDARKEANARVKATGNECIAVAKRLPDNYTLADWTNVNLGQLFSDLRDAEEINRKIVECREALEAYPATIQAVENEWKLEEKTAREQAEKEFVTYHNEIERQKKNLKLTMDHIDSQIAELQKQIHELEKKKVGIQADINNLGGKATDDQKAAINKTLKVQMDNIAKNRKEALARKETEKAKWEAFLEASQPIDIVPLNNKCVEAEEMKAFIPLASEVEALNNRLKAEEATADLYDKRVEAARMKPIELLEQVELPVKGLGINGVGIVTINGLPLSNLSTSKQVTTCLDIAKAISKNNPLKLICVDKLEHLDEKVRKEFLKQISDAQDWQFFVTCVTDGDLKIEAKG